MEPCAFNARMEQYEKLVYTVCLRFVHDEHLAQDLTQETFLSAWVHTAPARTARRRPGCAALRPTRRKTI